MTKKRSRKNRKSISRKRSQFIEKRRNAPHFFSKILTLLFLHSGQLSQEEIVKSLGSVKSRRKEILDELHTLIQKKQLKQPSKKLFALLNKTTVLQGRLDRNEKGFGFVTDLLDYQGNPVADKDIFIPKNKLKNAGHGSIVLVTQEKNRKNDKTSGNVIHIVQDGPSHLTGYVQRQGNFFTVIPEDPKTFFTVELSDKGIPDNLHDNDAVMVEISDHAPGSRKVKGKITEVFGPADTVDAQMRMVIAKHNIPHTFSQTVYDEIEDFSDNFTMDSYRLDLRHVAHVTIDGEDAKDFDDAVCVEKTDTGYVLYVSIADVSHYVVKGSQLDKEAYAKGTSIYFPGRVIPMLPEKLSNNLCSLVPDKDRLTFTAILHFSKQGKLKSKKFSKSIIQSKYRFTYNQVQQLLFPKKKTGTKPAHPLLGYLINAKELAEKLHTNRIERGSIGFNIPEPVVDLNDEGKIDSIIKSTRLFSHQLIEEFMLVANEAVAQFFTETKTAGVYRIHETPAPEKIEEFASFAANIGTKLPQIKAEPAWFGQVLDLVKDSPKEYVFNTLLLRTMQQARYSTSNVGHFGLAATAYTHFTSPIRRYPDLMVHRTLQKLLVSQSKNKKQQTTSQKEDAKDLLQQQAVFLSDRERLAVTAERDMYDRLRSFYMEQFIGETFDGIISGVSAQALFIELVTPYVTGSINIEDFIDDYYIYDPDKHRIIGELTMKTYQIGDEIKVRLTRVDKLRNRIIFTPHTEESAQAERS